MRKDASNLKFWGPPLCPDPRQEGHSLTWVSSMKQGGVGASLWGQKMANRMAYVGLIRIYPASEAYKIIRPRETEPKLKPDLQMEGPVPTPHQGHPLPLGTPTGPCGTPPLQGRG